jgi:hypothetical protein
MENNLGFETHEITNGNLNQLVSIANEAIDIAANEGFDLGKSQYKILTDDNQLINPWLPIP